MIKKEQGNGPRETPKRLEPVNSSPIQAVIFDYDGLLVDTEDHWFQSCRKVCAEYGVTITENHRLDLMRSGLSAYLVNQFSLPENQEIVRQKLRAAFYEYIEEGITPLPGAIDAVQRLVEQYPLGIGTGSRTEDALQGLKMLNIDTHFRTVVGGDQVERGKPAPDIYLKVAENLEVDPRRCLVFEDQPKGVAAANEAGMFCVVVPNRYLVGIDYSRAGMSLASLEMVDAQFINQLAKSSHFRRTPQ